MERPPPPILKGKQAASQARRAPEAELTGHARSFAAAPGLRESLTEELQLVGE